MPPLASRRPGLLYYVGRTIQLLSLLGLIVVSFIFPYVESFLQLLFFSIEGVVLFLAGWLMVRHALRRSAAPLPSCDAPSEEPSGEPRG
ncbi:MAG: hypothetical protein HYY96_13300 [Candidatus Tectomicrobia bacterium]|nr:hypothetical protein [Candidatus Tectomicrobia bacterium]